MTGEKLKWNETVVFWQCNMYMIYGVSYCIRPKIYFISKLHSSSPSSASKNELFSTCNLIGQIQNVTLEVCKSVPVIDLLLLRPTIDFLVWNPCFWHLYYLSPHFSSQEMANKILNCLQSQIISTVFFHSISLNLDLRTPKPLKTRG